MKYDVMFARYGHIVVEAESEGEAIAKTEGHEDLIVWENTPEVVDGMSELQMNIEGDAVL